MAILTSTYIGGFLNPLGFKLKITLFLTINPNNEKLDQNIFLIQAERIFHSKDCIHASYQSDPKMAYPLVTFHRCRLHFPKCSREYRHNFGIG